MNRHFFLAAMLLIAITDSVHADASPFPRFKTPDLAKSSSAATTALGLSLAAMFLFGGYWFIRNRAASEGRNIFSNGIPINRHLPFLLLSLGGLVSAVICLSQLHWTDAREEQRREGRRQLEERRQLELRQDMIKKEQPLPSPSHKQDK